MPYADKTSEKALAYRQVNNLRRRNSRLPESAEAAAKGPRFLQVFTRLFVALLAKKDFDHRADDCRRANEYRIKYPTHAMECARKARYGVSPEDFNTRLVLQKNKCAICGDGISASCHVDHDHRTGEVRGLLCSGCNLGLGQFKDSSKRLEQAAAYLKKTE